MHGELNYGRKTTIDRSDRHAREGGKKKNALLLLIYFVGAVLLRIQEELWRYLRRKKQATRTGTKSTTCKRTASNNHPPPSSEPPCYNRWDRPSRKDRQQQRTRLQWRRRRLADTPPQGGVLAQTQPTNRHGATRRRIHTLMRPHTLAGLTHASWRGSI